MEDHALTADSFAVSCIGLGWVGLGRVTENGPTTVPRSDKAVVCAVNFR